MMMWAATRRYASVRGAACTHARSAALSASATPSKTKAAAINRVRGTRDLLADDAEQHQHVLQLLQKTVNGYGFRPVR